MNKSFPELVGRMRKADFPTNPLIESEVKGLSIPESLLPPQENSEHIPKHSHFNFNV
jgi:hypothetical protein